MFQAIYGRPELAWNGTLRPLLSQSRWGIGKVFSESNKRQAPWIHGRGR